MKKLLVSLMILTALASCGKNNSVSSLGTNGNSSALTAGLDQWGRVPLTSYITDVNNNAFGAARADSETYRYLNYIGSTAGSGCALKTALGGFLTYYTCSGVSSTNTNYGSYDTVNVIHSTENLASKKNELLSIIGQQAQYSNSLDRKQLYIKTANGDVYTIDFRLPMSANPVVKKTLATGVIRTFDYTFSGYSVY